MAEKKCAGCQEWRSLGEFYKRTASKDGLKSRCKLCDSADKRADYDANIDGRRVSNRNRYASNIDQERARSRKNYATNPQKKLDTGRVWRVANIDRFRATGRQWRATHPENVQLASHLRRARIQENGVVLVTAKDVKRLKARPCYLCLIAPSTTLDHIIPIKEGGRHAIGNLLGACKPCNCRKGMMLLVEYRQYLRGIKVAA